MAVNNGILGKRIIIKMVIAMGTVRIADVISNELFIRLVIKGFGALG